MSAIEKLKVLIEKRRNESGWRDYVIGENSKFADEVSTLIPQFEAEQATAMVKVRRDTLELCLAQRPAFRREVADLASGHKDVQPALAANSALREWEAAIQALIAVEKPNEPTSRFKPGMSIRPGHGRPDVKTLMTTIEIHVSGAEVWNCTDGKAWRFYPDDLSHVSEEKPFGAMPPAREHSESCSSEISANWWSTTTKHHKPLTLEGSHWDFIKSLDFDYPDLGERGDFRKCLLDIKQFLKQKFPN